jgi:CoA:oxalate CoA-transferase
VTKKKSTNLLSGIRVLDLTRVMSGPFCTSMLADLGAEIIKIEMPDIGDEARYFGPFYKGESAYFMLLNRSKKSVTVNLKTDEGRALIRNIIPKCDVLIENFRPGVMERLGLDEKNVRQINQSIIYTSISGFGQDGPLKDWPAFDLVIQAMSGLMSLTGPKGGPDTAVGESIADICTGMYAAFGTVSALFDRERTNKGRFVDVAMLDSMMSIQMTGLARQLYNKDTPKPVGNRHPVTYPVDSFSTLNGDIVMVCFSDKLFKSLCELIGVPDLSSDDRFSSNKQRNINETELYKLIENWTKNKSQSFILNALLSRGIPAAPVWNLSQLTSSDHVKERGLITEGYNSIVGNIPIVPQPIRFSDTEGNLRSLSPALGEDTLAVLEEYTNLTFEELNALKLKKII